ncbi:hypothetical protein [Desulfoplanes sp.]
MRIKRHKNSNQSDRPRQETPPQREFRSTYRLGDLILAKIVEYQSENMAWVTIADLRVLAKLKRHYRVGTEIFLMVSALYPEIILQEATGDTENIAQGIHLIV